MPGQQNIRSGCYGVKARHAKKACEKSARKYFQGYPGISIDLIWLVEYRKLTDLRVTQLWSRDRRTQGEQKRNDR